MKNISNMLGNGNLMARERFLLLIQNDVHKANTGKEILSEADKAALENWKATTNEEAREWNRLNEGWKQSGRMDIEVEFIFKDAHIAYLAQLPILLQLFYYPSHQKMENSVKMLKKLRKVTIQEAIKIAAKQRAVKLKQGLDFEYAVYQLAFGRMSVEDKKRMNELYPDIETDHHYLDQEEVIANLFNGKKELTQKAKEKLAALVAEWSYNKFASEYQLFHYFACIPIWEVARYFLRGKGIEVKGKPMTKDQEANDEDESTSEGSIKAMETYAAQHKTTVRATLQEACLQWIDNGLFDEYMPLVISNSEALLRRWLTSKNEAKKILRQHVAAGELVLRRRTEEETVKEKLYSKRLYDVELNVARSVLENMDLEPIQKMEPDERSAFETFSDMVITGESLYAFKENYGFVKDFKEHADNYDPNLGIVYADDDPERKGDHLDKELVICSLTEKGEPSFFSLYGMATGLLSGILENRNYFEEKSEDGKRLLIFKDAGIEKIFKERRELLIDGFAKLLAFEGVFKKLAHIYEADMTHHVSGRIKELRGYIDLYNQSVKLATNTGDELKRTRNGFRRRDVLHTKEGWIIDLDSIVADENAIREHKSKLASILRGF